MKQVLLTLITFLSICTASAQDQFLIYSIKGNVTIVENKVESKAKVGKLLEESVQVKMGPDAKLTLICNESNLVTISKQGSFLLQDFKSQCATSQSNLSANYVRYVWSQLTQKPGTPEKNRKAFMKNVGAVSRSINSIWIDPRLDTMNYVNGNFPLSWKSYSEAEEYEFHLYDRNNPSTPITSITTKNKFVNIADLQSHLKAGNSYLWTASVKGETNNEKKVLNIVTKPDFDKFLRDMQQTDVTEGEAEKTFRIAFLLEQAHFLEEAFNHYQKAATLKPGLDLYKITLDAFKKDYALTK